MREEKEWNNLRFMNCTRTFCKVWTIFNITYTPWKLKSNATAEERAKFERERPYYEMRDGGNNIYKYMTSDRKLNGENSKSDMRDMISYFEKSTGVFNGDGFISQQELKAIQERAKMETAECRKKLHLTNP